MSDTTSYPECEKLEKVDAQRGTLIEFFEWLQSQGIVLTTPHEHEDGCYHPHEHMDDCGFFNCQRKEGDPELACGYNEGTFWPIREGSERLMLRFFGIDHKKLEQERQAILKSVQAKANA
jgi:hypothetical protein